MRINTTSTLRTLPICELKKKIKQAGWTLLCSGPCVTRRHWTGGQKTKEDKNSHVSSWNDTPRIYAWYEYVPLFQVWYWLAQLLCVLSFLHFNQTVLSTRCVLLSTCRWIRNLKLETICRNWPTTATDRHPTCNLSTIFSTSTSSSRSRTFHKFVPGTWYRIRA